MRREAIQIHTATPSGLPGDPQVTHPDQVVPDLIRVVLGNSQAREKRLS
jgi:hypothetical protein